MKNILFFALAFVLFSCGDTNFQTIKIGSSFQMDVPDYMEEAYDLNADASLQYQNTVKETYVIVINEDKQEFIDIFKELGEYDESKSAVENYTDIQTEYMSTTLTILDQNGPNSKKINGMDAMVLEYDGNTPAVAYDIFYYIAYIEGEEEMFMVMAWTLLDRKSEYKETFAKMVESFKEL
ncbi:MAG: hypothetical protein HUJ25_14480 [Crocinitomicaceae bacterium]|nr:hypothetical protein [Crocinitomicaceae bacterium]